MSAADAARPVSCTDPNYAAGLRERTLLVPCPACGAGAGERCIGAYGKPRKGRHIDRAYAAREAGFIMGRKGNLGRVRQLHHELLAVRTLTR